MVVNTNALDSDGLGVVFDWISNITINCDCVSLGIDQESAKQSNHTAFLFPSPSAPLTFGFESELFE